MNSISVRRLTLPILLIAGIVLPAPIAEQRTSAAPTAVDLSTYVRVGRFDLPESKRTSAPPNSLLAQEASAVTYNWDTDTLFIVGDGGTSVVQVTKGGTLIDSMTLAPGGSPQNTEFYDTEGLTYVGGGKFVLIEERYRQANLFTYVANGVLQRADVQTVKLGTTVGNVGLEGLSFDPATGEFIFVKEKDPQSIFQTGIDFALGTATNGSPTATSSTNLFNPALASLADLSDVFALSNLPSLNGQADSSHLLVLSQESGQIVNIDRAGTVHSRLTIAADPASPLGVPDMTMEGLTMDRDGFLYIVNEAGGGDADHPQLWVYAHSDATNMPPAGLSLINVVSSMPENTNTAAGVKVADVAVSDDGLGNNLLTLSGPDAPAFQITGVGLYLKPGTVLNSTTTPSYSVTITVDDPAVGATPDASVGYALSITPSTGGTAALVITEVAPWSSGNSPAALRVDWLEVTNVGTAAANITGWRMDDSSPSFGASVELRGIASIAPGESVIFMETSDANLAAKRTAFLATWFGANPPPNLHIGNYSGAGVGLSTDGDAVNLFDTTGAVQANVVFGQSAAAAPFRTFDNGALLNNTTIAALSATGVNGAFVAAGDPLEIGSPGTIGAPPTPVVSIAALDGAASETPGDAGAFRISRTGAIVGPLTVNYIVAAGAGQASAADVAPALTGAATISPGQAFVDVTVTPVDDGVLEGPEALTLTLFDTGSIDVGTPAAATVTIADNDAPETTIDSAPASPSSASDATIAFSSGSPASLVAGFQCSLDGSAFAACATPAHITGLTGGSHTFAVRAVSTFGTVDATPASVTWVVDTDAPGVSVSADMPFIDPPNGKMVSVTISGTVADVLSGADPGSVSFAVSDEYGEIQPSGPVVLQADGGFSFAIELEARRLGSDKDGRRYDIRVTARDRSGNATTAATTVVVAHDQRK